MTNPLPKYYLLLGEAQATSAAVDDFDLRTKDHKSVEAFNVLLADSVAAQLALVAYVSDHRLSLAVSLMKASKL